MKGAALARASWVGTAVFSITALVACLAGAAMPIAVVVDAALFLAGIGAFAVALVSAAARSREAEMGIGGLFFLAGSAGPSERRALLGSLAVEVVVALATSAARPFTALAFGILVPTYGLGLAGVWGARHGTFGPRIAPPPRPGAKRTR
ncbi:MAG: hypothetical protein QOG03_2391 [Actinomycetota bacterium]|nr:hypothetical protein [Actinomycetota bacterium]